MIDLPIELIHEIVTVLAFPQHPLQYGHKLDVKHALLQLSLVNHTVLDIVRPILYSTIVISSDRELRTFISAPPNLRGFSTSLWLRNFTGRFSSAANLIRVLGPVLRRLALDIPGNELDSSTSVREALRCCSRLEDFTRTGYSPMQVSQPYPFWPEWAGLRRLALDGPLVDEKFIGHIGKLPHLTHLALIEPRWRYSVDGTEAAIFMRLLVTGKSLQRLLLLYCQPDQLHLNSIKRLKSLSTLGRLQESPIVLYMVMEDPLSAMGYIRDQIGQGVLWDLDSRKLLGTASKRAFGRVDTNSRTQSL